MAIDKKIVPILWYIDRTASELQHEREDGSLYTGLLC